jgi:hypothetical protein
MWFSGSPRRQEGQGRAIERARPRRRPPGSAQLVYEGEAFLTGRLAEEFELRMARIPVWVWTNLVAHGSEECLCAENQAVRSLSPRCTDEWREARSYVVTEVLDQANRNGPLSKIQRAALVPLELELATRPEVAMWEPRDWVASVRLALGRYEQACRRAGAREAHPSR